MNDTEHDVQDPEVKIGEVADEVVDAPTGDEELRRSLDSVSTALVEINRLQAGMAALRQQYPLDVVVDVSSRKAMDHAIAGRAAYRTTKTAVEFTRKQAKAPILALGARLDTFAGELKDQLQAGQDHYDGPIQAELQRKENERLEREQAERDRVTALEARLQDIYDVAGRAVGLTSEQILKKFAMLDALEIDDSFFEFKGRAAEAKEKTQARLIDLAARAKESEERAEQARKDAEEVARLRAEKAERDAADARERQEREAKEAAERRQREEAAALERRQREETEARERQQREEEAARVARKANFYKAIAAQTERMSMAESADLRRRMYVLAQMIVPNLGDETDAAAAHLASTVEEITALETAVSKREAEAFAAQTREANVATITLLTVSAEKFDGVDPAAGSEALEIARRMVDEGRVAFARLAIDDEAFGSLVSVARTAAASVQRALNDLEARCDAAEPKAPTEPEIQTPPAEPDGQTERQDSNDGAAIPAAEAGQDAGELSQVHTQAHLPSDAETLAAAELLHLPVVLGFDQTKRVGMMQVHASALPLAPDYVFALEYLADQAELKPGSLDIDVKRHTLLQVSLQTDDQYIGFLRKTGKLLNDADIDNDRRLLNTVVDVMKAATATTKRGKPHTWVVPHEQMTWLKAALRAVMLPGGQFYAEDGTLMNADGTRSIFDDVDE